MKKKLVSTLLCVAMVSTMLAGCGGSDGAASTEGGDLHLRQKPLLHRNPESPGMRRPLQAQTAVLCTT